MKALHTQHELDAYIAQHTAVVVEFGTTWCSACTSIQPLFEELAGSNGETVKAAQVMCDKNKDTEKLAAAYGVTRYPVFVLFTAGKPDGRLECPDSGMLGEAFERLAGGGKMSNKRQRVLTREESGRIDLAQAFADADADKSGTLDKEEFKNILSIVGIETADQTQLQTIMAMVDLDKNGTVDYQEFCEWVKTKMPAAKIKTHQPMDLVLSVGCTQAMGCAHFMARFEKFKKVADTQVTSEKQTGKRSMEFELLNDWMAQEWHKTVEEGLKERARKEGVADYTDLQKTFAAGQISQICALGYTLDDAAKEALAAALERFYVCDVGPAPFSVHALVAEEQNDSMVTVTVSEHCLQVATHFLRHPPQFLSCGEFEELIVLALFHDVYYYDDFPNHDTRTLDLFRPWLRFEIPQQVVGHHLDHSPDPTKIKAMQFDTPLEALKNEWVQMDWYLTMVNMKQRGALKSCLGDGITLPLEFFHHYLGRFLTKDHDLIPVAPQMGIDVPSVARVANAAP